MKNVVIVKAGGRLSLSADKGSYDTIVDSLQRQITGMEKFGHPDEKLATVQVVDSVEAAKQLLDRAEVMIFVTAGLLYEARSIKEANPRLRVVVLTGLIPEDEVILVAKQWWTPDLIRDVITG